MDLITKIKLLKSPVEISHKDPIIMLGSCFAETIGNRLKNNKFQISINPFGILYNPASLSSAIQTLINPVLWTSNDLLYYDGLYHSFSHHSRFSALTENECLNKINNNICNASNKLFTVTRLMITFGTAFVYKLKQTGKTVANCHKLPASNFHHVRLSVSDIVNEWQELLSVLFERNNNLEIIFTVSPIRYMKYGAHENQLSKAILLMAVDELQKRFTSRISYFPAYELIMDELRDYRFYATDMCHPSEIAVQYIWEGFKSTYMNQSTTEIIKEIENIQKSVQHKPNNPRSDIYKQFVTQTLLKIKQLQEKIPYLCFNTEIEILKRNLL